MWTNRTAILFLFTTFATGLCGSFFFPLSSLFMVEALNATPAMLSAFLVLSVFSSVVVSQFIAYRSDRGWKRKQILLVSFFGYLVTVLGFSFIRDYYLAVAVSVVFGSVTGAIYGQAFALAREYADRYLNDQATTFLSTLRAGMALAWVFGPPIAFIIKAEYGFSATFLMSAGMIVVTIAIVFFFLPDGEMKEEKVEDAPTAIPWYQRASVVLFCLSMLMTFFANGLYLTAMPLYITKELGLSESLPGTFLGIAALCEIPIMLAAGWLAAKYGGNRVVGVALVCGMVFFIGIIKATEVWQLIAMQVCNGIFVGITASLGMVILQDMMKDQLGVASTLFSNVLQGSTLLASISIGIVGGMYNYYSTFYLSLGGTVLGLVFLAMAALRNRSTRGIAPAY
ncbi:sugar efflux transporter [Vibrio penaeicida]|uniref:sugar efflux transporter n=1 Tax=Vibrio penaeicida TaxID=104609 RepID=UPI0027345AF5|nr:sugar efflux transporter [Vibrio penaeicida]MDP2571730.1 sugar efflux transporter [Vibrio penaeicida]